MLTLPEYKCGKLNYVDKFYSTFNNSATPRTISKTSLTNSLKLPDIPDEVQNFAGLEERLVSPRTPLILFN